MENRGILRSVVTDAMPEVLQGQRPGGECLDEQHC